MPAYCSPTSPFISSQHQPALVFDFAQAADIPATRLLDGCGLDAEDMANAATRLSPQQLLRLLQNASRALGSTDTSFMLGQQMLPGHFGAVSHALIHAPNLREALAILARHQPRLTPLLVPRLMDEGPVSVLYWMDAFSAPALRPQLVELHMTAVVGMTRWLGGERLPWRFCFNRARPRHAEQHAVHLGSELRFDCQFDAQLIATEWLDRPWPRGNRQAMLAALRIADAELDAEPACRSVLPLLYEYLLEKIGSAPTLEQAAQHLGTSPATLKRHLATQGTHFQAELDLARAHASIHLLQVRGYDNEQVARYLGFHDARNFRRSFRRWTGLTPQLMRHPMLPAT
jgi:AraC-like DNA-binding protein